MTTASALTKSTQIRVERRSPAYWRVTFDNPPINVMGPEMVREFKALIDALEADGQVRVVVFDSAVENDHSDLPIGFQSVDECFELTDHLWAHDVDRRVVERDAPIGGRPPFDANLCGLRECACSCHFVLLSIL